MLEISETNRAYYQLADTKSIGSDLSAGSLADGELAGFLDKESVRTDPNHHGSIAADLNRWGQDPSDVAFTMITAQTLETFTECVQNAVAVAIDTETPISGPRAYELRVMSCATRSPTGVERAWVFDARDYDPAILADVFTGIEAAAWNANFDARVLDRAIWRSSDTTPAMLWWDAQLADALLYQGSHGFRWYHGLAWATEYYLGITAQGKGDVQISFDHESDLTLEQISYAAADAVETLWVADVLRREISKAAMSEICAIEQSARPFLDQMSRTGLWLDSESWLCQIDKLRTSNEQTLDRLAMLTGGGQITLFSSYVEPSWNPGSEQQTRNALNQYAQDHVREYLSTVRGQNRLLGDGDRIDSDVLKQIGGELAQTVLRYRSEAKLLNTYGVSMVEALGEDGRLHSQYLQVVGTNTGRLASRKPNVQNLAPAMAPYIRPESDDRVFVYADLSQAELRYLAQVSGDNTLIQAFSSGEDIHIRTAKMMFDIDQDQPDRVDRAHVSEHNVDSETVLDSGADTQNEYDLGELRQVAKALNFGIAYGLSGVGLARTLTNNGRPTTPQEGKELLDRYKEIYSGVSSWAETKAEQLHRVAQAIETTDWSASLKLAEVFEYVQETKRRLRKTLGRWPNVEEVRAQLQYLHIGNKEWSYNTSKSGGETADSAHGNPASDRDYADREIAQLLGPERDVVAWAMRFSSAVLLRNSNSVFSFSARTISGRRIQFNISTGAVCQSIVERMYIRSNQRLKQLAQLSSLSTAQLEARSHSVRDSIDTVIALIREGQSELVIPELHLAAKAQVHSVLNAWLNAPIQGGVADIMLRAFGELDRSLRHIANVWPVLSVHDSIVVECDRSDADRVAELVRDALLSASSAVCPGVTSGVDIDIRTSLSDQDIITQ